MGGAQLRSGGYGQPVVPFRLRITTSCGAKVGKVVVSHRVFRAEFRSTTVAGLGRGQVTRAFFGQTQEQARVRVVRVVRNGEAGVLPRGREGGGVVAVQVEPCEAGVVGAVVGIRARGLGGRLSRPRTMRPGPPLPGTGRNAPGGTPPTPRRPPAVGGGPPTALPASPPPTRTPGARRRARCSPSRMHSIRSEGPRGESTRARGPAAGPRVGEREGGPRPDPGTPRRALRRR